MAPASHGALAQGWDIGEGDKGGRGDEDEGEDGDEGDGGGRQCAGRPGPGREPSDRDIRTVVAMRAGPVPSGRIVP